MSTPKKSAVARNPMVVVHLAIAAILVVVLIPQLRHAALDVIFGEDSPSSSAPAPVASGDSYYEVTGTAERTYEAAEGEIGYCPLDDLERAVCAYGELTHELRAGERGADREDITQDPAGWGHNEKVEITSEDGSITYRGYMFNRSHLVADSLGGHPEMDNMVTGTRTQNVGFNNAEGSGAGGMGSGAGGMGYTEEIARDYLDSEDSIGCPLYYGVTPNYTGDELLPRTVTVDIQSCDQKIDERVVVSNTANGYVIDYTDGSFAEEG